MNYKNNIKNLTILLLKFILNNNKKQENKLLNEYYKYNFKKLKINEFKLFINNIYIIKIAFHSYTIINFPIDINFQLIIDIDKINLDSIKIDDYYNYNFINDGIIIKLYTHLYLKSLLKKEVVIKKKEEKNNIEQEVIIQFDNNELELFDFLNN